MTEIKVLFRDNRSSQALVGLILDDLYVSDSPGICLDEQSI
ncbi:MAG: hypothetical protein RTU92_01775 [Candidatus Thorarchaeota archaeon]